MSNEIFFQWQNEYLLKTIYPLREMKLRDFLVYFFEIDIWAKYKDKTIQDIQPEIKAFEISQKKQWHDAYKKYTDLRSYFLTEDVTQIFQKIFPQPDEDFLGVINNIHKSFVKYFPGYKDTRRERYFVTRQITPLETKHQEIIKDIATKQRYIRNMGPDWAKTPIYEKEIEKLNTVTLKMLDYELNQLRDFLGSLDKIGARRDALKAWFTQKDKEHDQLERDLTNKKYYVNRYPDKPKYKEELREVESGLARIEKELEEVNKLSEREQLDMLTESKELTVKDVVRGKVESYREMLNQKDQEELLEEIVNRFLEQPERYPLWLQYMVVHFSGMRYKSAHGSWGDPRDLLQSLRIHTVEERIKRAPDESIDFECKEKIEELRKKLVKAKDQSKKEEIEYRINGLESKYNFHRRKALLDILVDEQIEAIDENMKDDQVLEELEALKDLDLIPDWMWKEIVARTDLRIKGVTKEDWEDLSPEELNERYSYEDRKYLEIMDDWKRKNLTGWREEHDRANRLIVTRAVCNEVAEHIQHLRGHSPPGGLTAKPEWYLRNEKNPKLAGAKARPYLVKPSTSENFTPGASILWLRWVDRQPNAWQIALPITLKSGEGLLPGGITKSYTSQPTKAISKRRSGSQSASSTHGRWLRWIHEATIAEVAETVDGYVVLTFETALPYEDRRRSTIGVFKHYASDLKYSVTGTRFNGTFVGYVPEADLPYNDLKEMLDWNKILPNSSIPSYKIQNYWQKIAPMQPMSGDVSFSLEFQPETETSLEVMVEVQPRFSFLWHKEHVLCYSVEPEGENAYVYQPEVSLRRGLQLSVDKSNPAMIGDQTYYQVTRCDLEPRAEGLYVRQEDILELPEGESTKPVVTISELDLKEISPWNLIGKPVMRSVDVKISSGTSLFASKAHKISKADKGDGVIDAIGRIDYYLIVDCPTNSSVVGLCVPVDQVRDLEEGEFA